MIATERDVGEMVQGVIEYRRHCMEETRKRFAEMRFRVWNQLMLRTDAGDWPTRDAAAAEEDG